MEVVAISLSWILRFMVINITLDDIKNKRSVRLSYQGPTKCSLVKSIPKTMKGVSRKMKKTENINE